MFCCVPIWRLIAATDMATGAADPKMQPGVTRFQAFLTPPARSEQRRGLLKDVCKMSPCFPAALRLTQHASLLRRAECAALCFVLLPIRLRRLHLVAKCRNDQAVSSGSTAGITVFSALPSTLCSRGMTGS